MNETHAPTNFQPLQAAPAYLLLAERIEREIVSGRIRPGMRIGTEAELCEQFGVNRSTVREGIRLLEQSGFLRRDQSRRLYASLPQSSDVASRMSRSLVLHQSTFGELWAAALALETAAVEAAVENATPEDIEKLRDNIRRSRDCMGDVDAQAELDTEFHDLIAQACRNRVLQMVREPVGMLFSPTLRVIIAKVDVAVPRNLHAHDALADAIERRDLAQARAWIQKHIADWRRGFIAAGRDLDEPVERAFIEHMSAINSTRDRK